MRKQELGRGKMVESELLRDYNPRHMLFHRTPTLSTDDSGNQLVLAACPPPYTPGPYAYAAPPAPARVPSLLGLCIRALLPFPEQVHQLPVRLTLRPEHAQALLDDLVPDPATVDPRLWAILVQVFDALPPAFASYAAPLADIHLPLLQAIPSSSAFCLVTVLDLPNCIHLTDDTILNLRFLHTLTAFDASQSALSDYGVKSLAATLQITTDDHRGPWPLRILSLRNCKNVANDVYAHLEAFPLLSVVDLRGTQCTPNPFSPFETCPTEAIFYPTSTKDALVALKSLSPDLFSSSNGFNLHINSLTHQPMHGTTKTTTIAAQNSFVVIPSDANGRIKMGNTHLLERQLKAQEDALAHEQNKDAWYQRMEKLEGIERPDIPIKREIAYIKAPRQHRDTFPKPKPTGMTRSAWIGSGGETKAKPRPQTKVSQPALTGRSNPASISSAHITGTTAPATGPSRPDTSRHSTGSSSNPRMNPPPSIRDRIPPASISRGQALPHPVTNLNRSTSSEERRQTVPGEQVLRPSSSGRAQAQQPHLDVSTSAQSNDGTALRQRQTMSNALPPFRQPTRSGSDEMQRHKRRAAYESTRTDGRLRLFRFPPPWSALGKAVADRRKEEEEARQHREWQRAMPKEDIAMVDMTSEKAEMARKQIEEALSSRSGSRARTTVSFQEGEDERDDRRGSPFVANSSRYGSFEDATQVSSFLPSSSSSTISAPLPSISRKPRSRNPFRKRPASAAGLTDPLLSNAFISSSSDIRKPKERDKIGLGRHWDVDDKMLPSRTQDPGIPSGPRGRGSSSSAPDLKLPGKRVGYDPLLPGDNLNSRNPSDTSAAAGNVRNDKDSELRPISAVKVPHLSEELRKEALAKENKEITLATGNSSRKKAKVEAISGVEAKRKATASSSSSTVKRSSSKPLEKTSYDMLKWLKGPS